MDDAEQLYVALFKLTHHGFELTELGPNDQIGIDLIRKYGREKFWDGFNHG
jgi:hypothetical protein